MPALSLRNKVLIPVTLIFLTTISVALFIVHQVVRRQVLASLAGSLQTSRHIFQELLQKEWELLLQRGEVAAGAPHLKAAVDTGDSTTVQHVADEMFETLTSDLLIVLDAKGRVLAQHGLSSAITHFVADSLRVYQERSAGQIGVWRLHDETFRVASLPVVALDASGIYRLGNMIVGNRIDRDYLHALKSLVRCEIALRTESGLGLNTFPEHFQEGLQSSLLASASDSVGMRVMVRNEEFLAVEARSGRPVYVLLQSVDQAFLPLIRPIEITMLVVAAFAILAAMLVSRFISHRIVSPVEKLVQATDGITLGDYEHPVGTMSDDEIGHLAKRFDEMRRSLQQKMTQLRDQNLELQEALRTLERTQEELLRSEKLVATGKITAQLSHELNNPIHNIQNCLETAKKRIQKRETGDEFIDLAYEEVLRMGKLIRQMLDFYRPQVNVAEKADVYRIVRDVLKSSRKHFDENGIDVHLLLSDEGQEITTSPDQLKQVFLNLTLNAIDAMPNGGTLTVIGRFGDGMLQIDMADTGVGIPDEHLSKVFEAFFTTKSKASGVGLGLTVSYGIVRSLGGDIVIESEAKRGSKFTVRLPLNHELSTAQDILEPKTVAGAAL